MKIIQLLLSEGSIQGLSFGRLGVLIEPTAR